MRMKFIKGMTAGALMGAAAGMMILPSVNRGTRKKIRKSGRMVKNVAEDAYDSMMNWMK